MRNAKTFSKTQSSSGYQQTADMTRKEQQILLEATAKYDRFKKSASLPAYYLNKTRLKKITEIYRTLSTDKLRLSSKSRHSPAHTHTPSRPAPFTQLNLNALEHPKPKSRLTLHRSENTPQPQPSLTGNSAWGQLVSQLRCFGDRFQELLGIRSEDSFLVELDKTLEDIKVKGNRKNEDVGSCLKALGECLSRRERLKVSEVRREFTGMSTDLSNLQVELKKKMIRAMLDQKEIERQQNSNKDLQGQLTELRRKLARETREVGCGTEQIGNCKGSQNQSLIFANTEVLTLTAEGVVPRCSCRCNERLQAKTVKLAECMRRLQKYNRRQKELLAVLVVLRGEGVDVERIYDDVIQGRIEVPESEENSMMDKVSQVKRRERKQEKAVMAAIENCSAFQADDSLISSADGLSVNYGDMSMEDYAYTIRREYKCKHQLDPALKQQLKLNFDLLYDEQLYDDDYESESDAASNPPTI